MSPEHLLVIEYMKAFGFPICAAIALAYANVKIFRMYVDAVEQRNLLSQESADKFATLSANTSAALEKNTAAMAARSLALEHNTEATKELSERLLVSTKEQAKICRLQL